jgi:serine/threonine protein kinase
MSLASLDNVPFTTKYIDAMIQEAMDGGFKIYYICLVMEYCAMGDIANYHLACIERGRKIKRHVIVGWIYQVGRALKELHNQGIIHRDIKPENIFRISTTRVKVGDFGLASSFRGKLGDHSVGTYNYAAPELLDSKQEFVSRSL